MFYGSNEISNSVTNKGNWIISSLEYASYNSILLIPMLIGLKKYTKDKEGVIAISVSMIFLILALILYIVLLNGGTAINTIDLPLIYIVNQFGIIYKYIYGIMIVAAIYTSAIAAGYGFVSNCTKNKKMYKIVCMLICISAVPISKMGFSYLVDLLYPIFGLLGLIQIAYLFAKAK